MTSVLEDTKTVDADTDEPKFAHYASADSVTEGYIMGRPVKAICGKLFVPSRDPLKFPVCPICKELASVLFIGD